MSNQLSVLIPAKSFFLSIGEVTLRPFKFKQFKTALEIVEKYITIFTVYSTAQDIAMAMFEKIESDYLILGDICRLIELVANLSEDQVSELTYDEVLGLLTEIIEMNMDFFNRMGEKLNTPKSKEEKEQSKQQKTGESKSVA